MSNISKTQLRQSITQYLYETGEYKESIELAMAIHKSAQEVRSVLDEMVRDREVIEFEGKYCYINSNTKAEYGITKHINPPLTEQEKNEFELLKHNVHCGLYVIGSSLSRIRNLRLYREDHKNFEEFCQKEYGYGRQYVNRQIMGAEIAEDIKSLVPNWHQDRKLILPTSESQVRSLASFDKHKRVELWQKAVEKAGNKVPSARLVKEIADKESKKETKHINENVKIDRFKEDDVVKIVSKKSELKPVKGCLGQIVSVESFTYTVQTWRGTRSQISHSDLKLVSTIDSEQMRLYLVRLNLLRRSILHLQDADVDYGFIDIEPQNAPSFDLHPWRCLEFVGRTDCIPLPNIYENVLTGIDDFYLEF